MNKMKSFGLLTILTSYSVLSINPQFFQISPKGMNAVDERNNLCPSEGGNVLLSLLNGENNMLNPFYINTSIVGSVTLNSAYNYSLSAKSNYTFVFYGNFTGAYRGEGNNCNGYSIGFKQPANLGYVNYESAVKNTTLKSVINSSNEKVQLSIAPDNSRILLSFYTGNSNMGNVLLNKMNFTIDSTRTTGKITGVQLYKGSIDEFPGIDTSYKHNLCQTPDLSGDFEGPFDTGKVYEIHTEYGKTISSEILKSTLLAYDESDGKYHDVVLLKDDFKEHSDVLDTPLDIVFQATDDAGNISNFTFRIYLSDKTNPVIEEINHNKSISYSETLTENLLISNFKVTDNHPSGFSKIDILNCDLTVKKFIGKLNFTIEVTDKSNNKTSLDSYVNIIDDIAPVISGNNELNLNSAEPYSDEKIISLFSSTDEIDSQCNITIEKNSYSASSKYAGQYLVVLSSTDLSGNKSTKEVRINVADTNGPIFFVNKSVITTYSRIPLDPKQILQSILRENVLPEKNYTSAEIIEGDYGKSDVVEIGKYQIKLLVHSDDGNSDIIDVEINVLDNSKEEKTDSFWDRICFFFINTWNKIMNFFVNLF